MRKIEIEVFKFNELSQWAQDNAIKLNAEINTKDGKWIEDIIQDAKDVGVEIIYGKYLEVRIPRQNIDVAKAIIKNHGKDTETFKVATEFLKSMNRGPFFWNAIKIAYVNMFARQNDLLSSKSAIIATLCLNEYEFFGDGKMFELS